MTKRNEVTAPLMQVARDSKRHSEESHPFDPGYHQTLFIRMALDMSWQLALVVIVPIVGGHMLDIHYNKTPWFTLGGLAVAVVGVFGVLTKVVAEADKRVSAKRKRKS